MAAGATLPDILVGPTWAEERFEVGWAVLEAFRGRGLAAEIGRLTTRGLIDGKSGEHDNAPLAVDAIER